MRFLFGVLLLGITSLFQAAHAEPSGGKVDIISLRPYAGSVVYVLVSSSALCDTDTFAIDTSGVNGKEMYAAALTAVAAGKKISLEVSNATGCKGWGTRLQSIYLYP